MRKLAILVSFLIVVFSASAQRSALDSLRAVADLHADDTIGIKALVKLATEYSRVDPQTAKDVAYKVIAKGGDLKTRLGFSAGCALLTNLYNNEGNADSAKRYLDLMKVFSEGNEAIDEDRANYFVTAGLFYKNNGQFDTALPFMLSALDYLSAPKHEVTRAGQLLNIGNTYLNQGSVTKAAEYHLMALELFEKLGNKRGQSFCLQSLGNDFLKLRRLEDSRKYYEQSLVLKKELDDQRGMISTWIGLGDVNAELSRFTSAEGLYQQAVRQARALKLGLDELRALNNLGLLQLKMERRAEAEKTFSDALQLARQRGDSLMSARITAELAALRQHEAGASNTEKPLLNKMIAANQAGDKSAEAEAAFRLAEMNFRNGKFKEAYTFLQKYHSLNDSVRGKNVLVQIKQLEEKYQSDKKEKEIALLRKDQELKEATIARQRASQQIIILVFISLGVVAILLINHYRVVNRSRRLVDIEKVRNNIARDLHDDIGSVLSSIHIMSQLAMRESGVVNKHLSRIGDSAARMMESMSDIVWSINPDNDTVDRLIIKMKEFAGEILEPRNIRYHFELPADLRNVKLDVEKRRNLFLIFKECVNNAAKYSEGTDVHIALVFEKETLRLLVRDNGKGFEVATARSGNGLRNMVERARSLKGSLVQLSQPGKGTQVIAELPIT